MLKISTHTPARALNKAYRKEKVSREQIDRLKHELPRLLDLTAAEAINESTLRDHLQSFLRGFAYPKAEFLVQSEVRNMDTVIHDGPKTKDPIGVIIEAKTRRNKTEMFTPQRPNCKAMRELVLYFLRERAAGNVGIKQLIITNGDDFYLFADRDFERLFWEKKSFRKQLLKADDDPGKNNPICYEIIESYLNGLDDSLAVTVCQLSALRQWCEDGDPATDKKLIDGYKILSPPHLLRRPFANDSNKLDRGFYQELLHIIGLEEVKDGGKKVIQRLPADRRQPASLLENTLQVAGAENRFRHAINFNSYGQDREEREFAVALDLCLTWVNRVLFLKLLESQLVSYHGGDKKAQRLKFLTTELVPDYDGLNTLFFAVLAVPVAERKDFVAAFKHVPYLNSSLFEISPQEDQVIRVNSLKDQFELPLATHSVLQTPVPHSPLHYLFAFLDAYDFGGEGKAAIQEDNKRLINASVLGLIFEKINGYRDGSFYTPGFITEYMCRETIRRAVVQKFREHEGLFADFSGQDFTELTNFLSRDNYKTDVRRAANQLVDGLTVCDPAVGSGHFLVSALNELIATKSALGILGAAGGGVDLRISAEVANDELLVTDLRTDAPFDYRVSQDGNGKIVVNDRIQSIQETLFHEKRTLIENCLFGVDLNPNSVKICRLRLWIELLKHAYYRSDEQGLQTLPNIDINIKQGNSLVSRFALDDDLSSALDESERFSLDSYRVAVAAYQRATGPEEKQGLLELIDTIKGDFQSHIGRNDKRVKTLSKARGRQQQLESLLATGDLFGQIDKSKVNKELAKVSKKVASVEAVLEATRSNVVFNNAFEWRFEFPAVLDDNGNFIGFDVVVGNPPYIRQEELGELKNYLKDHYEVYAGTADLLVYFLELSMKNLRKNGQFSFIISNKFMRAGFGKALRRHLQQFRIVELIDFGDLQVFDGATTYPLIISLEKTPPTGEFHAMNVPELQAADFRTQVATHRFISLQSELTASGWNLADATTQRLLEKLRNTGVPLGEYVNGEIYYGIKTGYNKAFVIDSETKERLIAEDPQSTEVIKPFLAGRDVKRYVPPVAEKYLLFIPWHFPLHRNKSISGVSKEAEVKFQEKYPAVYNHLLNFKEELSNRNKAETGIRYEWYALQRCAATYYEEFDKPKIIIPALVNKPSYSYDKNGNYGNDKTTILPLEEERVWLLSLLNSSAVDFYLKSISSTKRGGYFEYKPVYLSALPILEPNTGAKKHLSTLTTQILSQKAADPSADTTALEEEIDVLVYKLYGLTYAEVLVVDPDFALGEVEYAAVVV